MSSTLTHISFVDSDCSEALQTLKTRRTSEAGEGPSMHQRGDVFRDHLSLSILLPPRGQRMPLWMRFNTELAYIHIYLEHQVKDTF